MVVVLRTECIEVKPANSLRQLCHLVKNLYNRANYLIKSHLNEAGSFLGYLDLDWILKDEICYKLLPVQTSQQTLKLLSRNWKSYFKAKQEWKQNPNKFLGPPRSPQYKSSKGEYVAIFSNQQVRFKDGWIILPKKVNFRVKTRLPSTIKLREVRVVPRRICYTVEIVYQKVIRKRILKNLRGIGAIDLGLTNLVTFVDNLGNKPIVIKDKGKGIKSITQYYLKEKARLQEIYQKQQKKSGNKTIKIGESYYKLQERWRRQVKNWLHQVSNFLVKNFEERGIHKIIIGYNPLWKQRIKLMKKTSQLFSMIPFQKLIEFIKYKSEERGIQIILIDEAHTSKCSFLDNEISEKKDKYLGKRVSRGIFQSLNGVKINADVNAAYNILRKSDPKAFQRRSVNGVGGYVTYPLCWTANSGFSTKKVS